MKQKRKRVTSQEMVRIDRRDFLRLVAGATGGLAASSLLAACGQTPTPEQASALSSVPGIGMKTAKKIILDLKDKIQGSADVALPESKITEDDAEVIAALTTLGYSVIEAQTALQHVPASVQGVEARLLAALAYFGA